MTQDNNNDWITRDEAAALLGLKPRTLKAWEIERRNPIPFYKFYTRHKYRRSEVLAYLESTRIEADPTPPRRAKQDKGGNGD